MRGQQVFLSVTVQKRELSWPQDLDGQTRFVELYIVNDFSQVKNVKSFASHTGPYRASLISVLVAVSQTLQLMLQDHGYAWCARLYTSQLSPVPNCCLVTETHGCEQFAYI